MIFVCDTNRCSHCMFFFVCEMGFFGNHFLLIFDSKIHKYFCSKFMLFVVLYHSLISTLKISFIVDVRFTLTIPIKRLPWYSVFIVEYVSKIHILVFTMYTEISSAISRQNTHFNICTETSK